MTIPRYRVEYEMYLTCDNVKGDLIDLKDLVKYLQDKVEIYKEELNKYDYDTSYSGNECRLKITGSIREIESILKEIR